MESLNLLCVDMNAKEFAHELEKAASFIRQQQAEIEALKAGKIRAYDNGYEDGRKPDTNPKLAKTLTDEKITAISKKIFKDYKNFHHYQLDFARAVIKEVSGK